MATEPEEALRYTLKIGEIFRRETDGIKSIQENLRSSRKIRLADLPASLLTRLSSSAASATDVEVFVHEAVDPKSVVFPKARVEVVHARWLQDLFGTRCRMGEVLTPTALYRVYWA
jgi:hypothetical protein